VETAKFVEQRRCLQQLRLNEGETARAANEAERLKVLLLAELKAIRLLLIPVAERAVPSVVDMTLRALIPMPEDLEQDRIEAQRAIAAHE
jgi:hypothetical protein